MELFFSERQRQDILQLLAAILHLGNVSFEGERSQTHAGLSHGNDVNCRRLARKHAGSPGHLPRQQVEALEGRGIPAGGELFLQSNPNPRCQALTPALPRSERACWTPV